MASNKKQTDGGEKRKKMQRTISDFSCEDELKYIMLNSMNLRSDSLCKISFHFSSIEILKAT